MSSSKVGPWAKDKLDRLNKYLSAYTTVMKEQSDWCQGYYYIDAFAGPGRHELRAADIAESSVEKTLLDISQFGSKQPEHENFISGSPQVALEIKHPFTGYVFVEKDPERVSDLEALKKKYGQSRKILIRKKDCNEYLMNRVVKNSKIEWKKNRALVFLDPFGMQVKWSTLESLASTKAIEVFLNFPVGMAIQRLLPRQGDKLTEQRVTMLNDYFGSPDWRDQLYKTEKTLFEDDYETKIEKSGETLLRWYANRLKTHFGFVSDAALIRNSKNKPLYYLILASPKKTGASISSSIFLRAGETIRL